jgi:hypothetical protein
MTFTAKAQRAQRKNDQSWWTILLIPDRMNSTLKLSISAILIPVIFS